METRKRVRPHPETGIMYLAQAKTDEEQPEIEHTLLMPVVQTVTPYATTPEHGDGEVVAEKDCDRLQVYNDTDETATISFDDDVAFDVGHGTHVYEGVAIPKGCKVTAKVGDDPIPVTIW